MIYYWRVFDFFSLVDNSKEIENYNIYLEDSFDMKKGLWILLLINIVICITFLIFMLRSSSNNYPIILFLFLCIILIEIPISLMIKIQKNN